jgi:glycosyltransferase involved in cell wall biosynthesis
MLKVLFVIPEFPPSFGGGIGTFYGHLLPALADRGADVKAIVGSGLQAGPDASNYRGVTVAPLDQQLVQRLRGSFSSLSLSPDLINHLAAAWAAWEQASSFVGFDVIECTDWGLFAVPWLLNPSSPPLLIRCHGSAGQIAIFDSQSCFAQSEFAYQLVESALFPRASVISTYSILNLNWWQSQLNRNVRYCPPPYEVGSIHQSRATRLDHGLVVGRIQKWKGPETLCRAIMILGDQAPTIDWVGRSVAGPNGNVLYSDYLGKLFPDIWGFKILPLPPEPPSGISRRQAQAAFVVVPSDWDVFNLSAAEAMSQKAVVICSDAAGASDLIEHGENGFIFKSGNSKHLAELIQRVQNLSVSDRLAIGDRARKTVQKNLDPDRIACLVFDELKLAKTLGNRVPKAPDLLARYLTPTSEDILPSMRLFESLDRVDLKELIRYVALRTCDRLLRRVRT